MAQRMCSSGVAGASASPCADPMGTATLTRPARVGTNAWTAGGKGAGGRVAGVLLLLLWVALSRGAVAQTGAAAAAAPSIFLGGASIPRAKALALDAALLKGWRVAESEWDQVVFETLLDTPASPGPSDVAAGRLAPPRQTLLRIRADFTAADSGVMTELRAEEIWYLGTPREWRDDVTSEYRANLMNALQSLGAQWAGIAPAVPPRRAPRRTGVGAPGSRQASQAAPAAGAAEPASRRRGLFRLLPEGWPRRLSRSAPTEVPARRLPPAARIDATAAPRPVRRTTALPPAPIAVPSAGGHREPAPADDAVGVWAYYAEAFATDRGCALADRGAVLVGDGDAGELHQVHCRDGSSVMVRCNRISCTAGR